ncbi:ABC transporter, ATP-binding protein [Winkia neuii]|uniref:ABC transporter ATP-binding protein n=1 Tax=Winkia neuii TaxID=33007 RepID=UPI000763F476|nr:ABC transporter ATP-binding protein [Winkia neuii]KWZ75041.1 ABC transporter, ATP-binding protein [Winkia neuii]
METKTKPVLKEPQTSCPPALQIEGARRAFGKVQAVGGVDLTIGQGELVALLGRNGAGKTTLLDIALGLGHPDTGRTQLFGLAPRDAIRRGLVGVIQQEGGFPTSGTVRSLLRLAASSYRNHIGVDAALKKAGISDLAGRRLSKCSGGQRQRFRLAMALLPAPRLLLMDEPTAGMDVASRKEFWEGMRSLTAEGVSIIFATHYLQEAEDVAGRIVIMDRGKIAMDKPKSELIDVDRRAHVRAILPAGSDLPERLAHMCNKWDIRLSGNTLSAQGMDLEPLALRLLQTPGVRGFQMTRISLDDIFTSITSSEGEPR